MRQDPTNSATRDQVISRSRASSRCKQSRRDQDVRQTSKRLSLGDILQLCKVRSFYIIDCTDWMNLFNTDCALAIAVRLSVSVSDDQF